MGSPPSISAFSFFCFLLVSFLSLHKTFLFSKFSSVDIEHWCITLPIMLKDGISNSHVQIFLLFLTIAAIALAISSNSELRNGNGMWMDMTVIFLNCVTYLCPNTIFHYSAPYVQHNLGHYTSIFWSDTREISYSRCHLLH